MNLSMVEERIFVLLFRLLLSWLFVRGQLVWLGFLVVVFVLSVARACKP